MTPLKNGDVSLQAMMMPKISLVVSKMFDVQPLKWDDDHYSLFFRH
jgi:hypothetical protein